MDRSEAAALLGVAEHAERNELRTAYRRLLRRHHPDVTGGDGATTRALTEAYRTLLAEHEDEDEDEDAFDEGEPTVVTAATDDTLTLLVPPDEAFLRLLDAGARLGEVTYVDDDAGLLEVIVTFDDARTASLVVTLQGRGDGTTDAFCTLEPLDRRSAPPVSLVVDALRTHLA